MALSNITVPKLYAPVAALSISGTTARSAAISTGLIRVTPTTDCFILFGDGTVEATTSTGNFLQAGSVYDLSYAGTNFAVITSGGTGTVYASELI